MQINTKKYLVRKGLNKMIILVGSNKGGTGKTTTATNLATAFLINGYKVLLCDSDKQQSLLQWNSIRKSDDNLSQFDLITLYGEDLNKLQQYKSQYDYIIVDVAGRNSEELLRGLAFCDVFITPIQSTQFDLNTLIPLNGKIEQLKGYNTNLLNKCFVLHSRATTNIFIKHKERLDVEAFVNELPGFKLLKSSISERKIYKDAVSQGKAVFDDGGMNDKAVNEIFDLITEIIGE